MVGNGFGQAVAVWLILAAAAFLMGAVREVVLRPRIGERRAHQAGTVASCVAFAIISWFAARRLGYTPPVALGVGSLWAAGGIAFDYTMVCVIGKQPKERFVRDYRIREGRWTVFLWLTLIVAPLLATLMP